MKCGIDVLVNKCLFKGEEIFFLKECFKWNEWLFLINEWFVDDIVIIVIWLFFMCWYFILSK